MRALHAVGPDATYLDIEGTWGHGAFLLEVRTMTRLIESFLDRLSAEKRSRLAVKTTGEATTPGSPHLCDWASLS